MRTARRYGIAALAAFALALGGCGEDKKFDAQGFVEDVNAEGVKLQLGEPLITSDEGQEVYAIELEPLTDLPDEARPHSEGSLSVFDEDSAAEAEIETCRASADLLCYRASNVVVVLEGGGIEAQQLAVAMERLSDD
jgi:hypothetical protein